MLIHNLEEYVYETRRNGAESYHQKCVESPPDNRVYMQKYQNIIISRIVCVTL